MTVRLADCRTDYVQLSFGCPVGEYRKESTSACFSTRIGCNTEEVD